MALGGERERLVGEDARDEGRELDRPPRRVAPLENNFDVAADGFKKAPSFRNSELRQEMIDP